MPVRTELLRDLQGLSENTKRSNAPYGHLFCNETLVDLAVPQIEAQRKKMPKGVGLVIGSGGIMSLLPSLDLDGVIMVDINPAVLAFGEHVGQAIRTSDTPSQAEQVIFEADDPEKSFASQMYVTDRGLYMQHLYKYPFTDEYRNFGTYHWRNTARFEAVKTAVEETPIVFVQAYVTSPAFLLNLTRALYRFGQPLSYVNFSNLSTWRNGDMDFIDNLPIERRTTIQFATFEDTTVEQKCPRVHVTDSVSEYKQRVRRTD